MIGGMGWASGAFRRGYSRQNSAESESFSEGGEGIARVAGGMKFSKRLVKLSFNGDLLGNMGQVP
jgi:hypothetical protein